MAGERTESSALDGYIMMYDIKMNLRACVYCGILYLYIYIIYIYVHMLYLEAVWNLFLGVISP